MYAYDALKLVVQLPAALPFIGSRNSLYGAGALQWLEAVLTRSRLFLKSYR